MTARNPGSGGGPTRKDGRAAEHKAADIAGPPEPTRRIVKMQFCIFCRERRDNPSRSKWCDTDPFGAPVSGVHRWGAPVEFDVKTGRELHE